MFFGTYERKIESDGRIGIPKELTDCLRKDGYRGFSSTLELEETRGIRFYYLCLDPIKEETSDMLSESVISQINPHREPNLVFLGSNDYVLVCSPSNWDMWKREYMPRLDELLDDLANKKHNPPDAA